MGTLLRLPPPSDPSEELGGSGRFGFSVKSGLHSMGFELDNSKSGCEERISSQSLQRDCEDVLLFGGHSRCGTSAVGTLLVVHEELNSGPKWTCAKGLKETVSPFLHLL